VSVKGTTKKELYVLFYNKNYHERRESELLATGELQDIVIRSSKKNSQLGSGTKGKLAGDQGKKDISAVI